MSNQAALRVHTQPGDIVLAPVDAHVHIAETSRASSNYSG
jgi:threonine aldolase